MSSVSAWVFLLYESQNNRYYNQSKAFVPIHITYTFKLTHKQVQNRAWMLGILIADHLQNGMGKKNPLPKASLRSLQLGASGAGLLASWQHMFGAKNTNDLHFLYIIFTKPKCSLLCRNDLDLSLAINHK